MKLKQNVDNSQLLVARHSQHSQLVHKKQLSQVFSCSCHAAFMEKSQCFLGDCCLPTIQWKREKKSHIIFWEKKNKVKRFHDDPIFL